MGSLIGGVIGLKVITAITGAPLGGAILSRIMLAVSMLRDNGISSSLHHGTRTIGWTIGYLLMQQKLRLQQSRRLQRRLKRYNYLITDNLKRRRFKMRDMVRWEQRLAQESGYRFLVFGIVPGFFFGSYGS